MGKVGLPRSRSGVTTAEACVSCELCVAVSCAWCVRCGSIQIMEDHAHDRAQKVESTYRERETPPAALAISVCV
mgnify:CR=1 FL=1